MQLLNPNLKMCTPKAVVIHAGINDALNHKSQSNNKKLSSNIKYMIDNCRKFDVKNILISGYSLMYMILEALKGYTFI